MKRHVACPVSLCNMEENFSRSSSETLPFPEDLGQVGTRDLALAAEEAS